MANIDANHKFVLSFRLLLYNPKAQRIHYQTKHGVNGAALFRPINDSNGG